MPSITQHTVHQEPLSPWERGRGEGVQNGGKTFFCHHASQKQALPMARHTPVVCPHPSPLPRGEGASRSGFSLLEVLLSLSIMVGAIVALSALIEVGIRHAVVARSMTEAQLLCESKLAEITSGIQAAEPISQAPLLAAVEDAALMESAEEGEWYYSVEVTQLDQEMGLASLRVTVFQNPAIYPQPLEFSLVRWIPDPGIVVEEPTTEDGSNTESSTTSSSTTTTTP